MPAEATVNGDPVQPKPDTAHSVILSPVHDLFLNSIFLLSQLDNPEAEWEHVAVTTYGRNNHAVRDEYFRYIHYEDGLEELYDHRIDNNEWNNLTGKKEYNHVKSWLKQFLPKINEPWASTSAYNYNKYLHPNCLLILYCQPR